MKSTVYCGVGQAGARVSGSDGYENLNMEGVATVGASGRLDLTCSAQGTGQPLGTDVAYALAEIVAFPIDGFVDATIQ